MHPATFYSVSEEKILYWETLELTWLIGRTTLTTLT